jgi:hypothetical protein
MNSSGDITGIRAVAPRAFERRALLEFVEDRITAHPLPRECAAKQVQRAQDVVCSCTIALVQAMGDLRGVREATPRPMQSVDRIVVKEAPYARGNGGDSLKRRSSRCALEPRPHRLQQRVRRVRRIAGQEVLPNEAAVISAADTVVRRSQHAPANEDPPRRRERTL